MKLFAKILITLCIASSLFAGEHIRIELGNDYSSYSEKDLRQRVWQLERAVAELQEKVFDLKVAKAEPVKQWTCRINGLSQPFSATKPSKGEAKALALKKCSEAGSSIFCKEKDMVCED